MAKEDKIYIVQGQKGDRFKSESGTNSSGRGNSNKYNRAYIGDKPSTPVITQHFETPPRPTGGSKK